MLDDQAKQILENAKEASKSTRTIIYFILISLFTLGIVFRTTSNPDWLTYRMHLNEEALFCWKSKLVDSKFDKCQTSIDYTVKHITPRGANPNIINEEYLKTFIPDKEYLDSVYDNIKDLRKKRLELRIVTMPLIGLAMDVHDLGFIACIIFAILYIILYGNIVREHNIYRLITDPHNNIRNQLQVMYPILCASHVFSNTLSRFSIYILIGLPSVCVAIILGYSLHGFFGKFTGSDLFFELTTYDLLAEFICVSLSVIFSIASLSTWYKLNKLLDSMDTTL